MKNNPFLKVFEVLRNFSQKVSKWGAGAKPLTDKMDGMEELPVDVL